MGGLQLKDLPTGPGDKLSLDFTYVDGAAKYLISGVTGSSFDAFSGGTNFAGSYYGMAVLSLLDGVYTTGPDREDDGLGFPRRLPAQLVADVANRRVRQLHAHRVQHECHRSVLCHIHGTISEVERLHMQS